MTEDALRALLAERMKPRGAQKTLAAQLGVSQAFVSMVVAGRKHVTDEIAAYLGYRRVVEFRPLHPERMAPPCYATVGRR